MSESSAPHILRAPDIAAKAQAQTFSHPWTPNSEISGVMLGRALGLKRTGVSHVRVRAGEESFVYHAHHSEEEWIYILSGKGVAEADGSEREVSAGDFLAFPTPSVAHHLRNPFVEDLVYLMGGENHEIEVADFPKLGKRMLRRGTNVEIYDLADGRPFGPLGV